MPETIRINFVTGAARRYMSEVEALAALPERVAAAVAGAPASWVTAEPKPGEWSPARVLGHLVAYARISHENLYRMSYMTDPLIKRVDDEGENERNDWAAQPTQQLLTAIDEGIARSVELLKELPDASWGRPGQHPEDGRRSIRQHAVAMVKHFDEHIAQIEAARACHRPRVPSSRS